MRRKDREITDFQEKLNILDRAMVCRLGLNDPAGAPYVVPVNFGYVREGEEITLYIHGAAQGKKLELIGQDPRVGFEVDGDHALLDGGLNVSYQYESLIGRGRAEILTDPTEKRKGLFAILRHQTGRGEMEIPEALLGRTAVIAIRVEAITGKRNKKTPS